MGGSMSEANQVPGRALFELFDEAIRAYDNILKLASVTGIWDNEKTITELARKIVAAKDSIADDAERITRIYIISATVAGRKPDKRKVNRLIHNAKKIEKLAERIDKEGRRGNVDLMFQYDRIADNFVKDLIRRGESPMVFYTATRNLLTKTAELSKELIEKASDNLALIGVLPRRRILEEFEESVPDVGKLSEPVNDNEGGEADQ
jgi:hypothetical protein